jgi:hypothetical protein
MAEKDPEDISWAIRFIIISISFFIFSLLIKLLNGTPDNISLFIKIGFISIGLSVLCIVNSGTLKLSLKKRKLSGPGKD